MDALTELSLNQQVWLWIKAMLILVVGLLLVRLLANALYRAVDGFMDVAAALTLKRIVIYLLSAVVVLSTLYQLGFDLGVLLGAAGILSVALGFASQTSASNLVSGLFMVLEKSFAIGDIIQVGGTMGEVLSIDLLSVKVRTFDNLFVRIPNESLIKTEIKNLSRFPIRRYDMQVGVAYKEDLKRVSDLLIDVADAYEHSLDQPRPLIIFQGFGESSMDLQFCIWTTTDNYLKVRNEMPARVKEAFDDAGIEIPFPHRTLYTGAETTPFPIRTEQSG
jgi:small-conductance mechanosensitive channel